MIPISLDRAQAVFIEEHALGAVLVLGEGFEHIRGIPVDVFTSVDRQDIYRAMSALDKTGLPVDFMTVQDELDTRRGKNLERSAYLSQITDGCSGTDLRAAKTILVNRLSSRTLFDILTALTAEMEAGAKMEDIAVKMLRSAQEALPSVGRTCELTDLFGTLRDYQEGERSAFLPSGISSIDDEFPIATNELTVIGAQSSVGKTSLAMSLAHALAMRGSKCLYITMESSAQEIMLRRLSIIGRVSTGEMKTRHKLSGQQYSDITGAFRDMKDHPVVVMGGSYTSLDLCTEIRAAKIEHDIKAAFMDHIGKVKLPGVGQHRHELGQITADLASVAKELGVSVFALSQLNRQVAAREDHRPVISDLRDSGEIEQDADVIWLLHRPGRHQEDNTNALEVIIAKNRNGKLGSVELEFVPEQCHVRERGGCR